MTDQMALYIFPLSKKKKALNTKTADTTGTDYLATRR